MQKEKHKLRVAVVGGGASGMTAAIAAAESGADVLLLERQARLGRKLAATGNGRCNLTNLHAAPEHYHGEERDFCAFALQREEPGVTLRRFRQMGLLTVSEEDGRVYPMSDSAGSVVDVLRFTLDALGVRQACGSSVESVRRRAEGFVLRTASEELTADRLIVACGGQAGGKLGGTGDGYRLLESLGHSCTRLVPSLVQLRTEGNLTRSLKGVRTQAGIRVLRGGRTVREIPGEVQFTEYGLSGPGIFAVSRTAGQGGDTVIALDLFPDLPLRELEELLRCRVGTRPELTLDDLFTGTIQNRLGRTVVRAAGLSGTAKLAGLDGEVRLLARKAKRFEFRVTGDLGFDQAQVTAGGIRTEEFHPETLESRLCPGLYACGEVLDIDGDCGGYNLQWAWASGRLAGESAGRAAPC